MKTVAIGGLNASNVARVRYQSETLSDGAKLDGVAVVSALMSADNPREAAGELKRIFVGTPSFIILQTWKPRQNLKAMDLRTEIARVLKDVQKETPLVHHLTNNVISFDNSAEALGC